MGMLEVALAYAEAGWRVLPVRGKAPEGRLVAHGVHDATDDLETVRRWWAMKPDAGIGIAIPDRAIVVDADPRHNGDHTLSELEQRHGELPETVEAETGGGGLHIWLGVNGLRRVTATLGEGVDLKTVGGYVVVPPSRHPSGGRYRWREGLSLLDHEIAPAPAWLLMLLEPGVNGTRAREAPAVFPEGSRHNALVSLAGSMRRRGMSTAAVLAALLTENAQKCQPPLPESEVHSIAAWQPPEPPAAPVEITATALEGRPATVPIPARLPLLPRLPESFWRERPVFAHIRQAAHSRLCSADAVLYCVLARIAAFRSPFASIDTSIKDRASLNLLVALVGPSGAGKSSQAKIARRLLPAPKDYEDWDGLPIGTGEGIADAYMGWATREVKDQHGNTILDKKGKPKYERFRCQMRQNALFYADEGAVLASLNNRKGAILLETLRMAFNAVELGQTNASEDSKRLIKNYSFGLIAGLQYEIAATLFGQVGLGTPQRFVFTGVLDPTIPDELPPWPGELVIPWLQLYKEYTLDEDVNSEIRQTAMGYARGKITIEDLDAHAPLLRLKLAGALASLEGRAHVTPDDWKLGTDMWETSCAVRTAVLDSCRTAAAEKIELAKTRYAEQAVAADRAVRLANVGVIRTAGVIRNRVRKAKERNELPCKRRDIDRAIAGRDGQYREDAWSHALGNAWIVEVADGEYVPGDP